MKVIITWLANRNRSSWLALGVRASEFILITMSTFLPVDEQMDLLRKGAAEIIRVSDLRERLEESRNSPGTGLGLSLVAAVARLHDARLDLDDARPGLKATLVFPNRVNRPAPQPRIAAPVQG